MKFWICPPNNIVCVDDAPISVDLSNFVPANIYLVDWSGKEGSILYADRLGIREKFTDPSVYEPQINQWMLAAQNSILAVSPTNTSAPITLSQAQFVKRELVKALFDLKRQANIDSGGTTWNASDESVSAMQSQAIQDLANANNAGSAKTDALASSMNDSITHFNDGVSDFNTSLTSFNTDSLNLMTSQNAITTYINVNYVNVINGTLAGCSVTNGGSPHFVPSSMPHQALPDTLTQPTMPSFTGMNPVSAGTSTTTPTPTQDALNAILNRRNSLNATQGAKLTQINNLTTVPAVAAYDVNAGW